MVGAITSWDILTHPLVTIQAFGWPVFFKALFASHGRTFLSLIPESFHQSDRLSLAGWVDRCIDLELRAKNVYVVLAAEYVDKKGVCEFFEALADQEQDHADLLALCHAAARRSGWNAAADMSWLNELANLDDQMLQIESSLHESRTVRDALHLVIELESAEINHLFQRIMEACDSAFVKRLGVFREAIGSHLAFITEQIPKLDSELQTAVQCLQEPSCCEDAMSVTAV